MEWLRSPIMYMEQYSFLQNLRNMSSDYFSPKRSTYHYHHMASGNYREYLQGEEVKIKKYFYALRPILACKWVENNKSLPPMEFETLLDTQVKDQHLYSEIKKLLERKKSGEELDIEPRISVISDFLDNQIEYYQEYVKDVDDKLHSDISTINELFRNTLKEVWE